MGVVVALLLEVCQHLPDFVDEDGENVLALLHSQLVQSIEQFDSFHNLLRELQFFFFPLFPFFGLFDLVLHRLVELDFPFLEQGVLILGFFGNSDRSAHLDLLRLFFPLLLLNIHFHVLVG